MTLTCLSDVPAFEPVWQLPGEGSTPDVVYEPMNELSLNLSQHNFEDLEGKEWECLIHNPDDPDRIISRVSTIFRKVEGEYNNLLLLSSNLCTNYFTTSYTSLAS